MNKAIIIVLATGLSILFQNPASASEVTVRCSTAYLGGHFSLLVATITPQRLTGVLTRGPTAEQVSVSAEVIPDESPGFISFQISDPLRNDPVFTFSTSIFRSLRAGAVEKGSLNTATGWEEYQFVYHCVALH